MKAIVLICVFNTLLFMASPALSKSAKQEVPAPITGNGTDWYHPPVPASWQWQLLGEIDTRYAVDIYDIDLFDQNKNTIKELQDSGKRVICYFSAGSWENWRADAKQFDKKVLGDQLEGWINERWLDIRAKQVQDIMLKRLDLAVSKGCDGVEPDNMDGFQNDTHFGLTAEDQLSFNRFIANEAHKRHLSVGLKNDLDQIPQLVDYFDFAVNEECFEYKECDKLTPFIQADKPVLNAEYDEEFKHNNKKRDQLCDAAKKRKFSTLILNYDLDDSYRYSCLDN